MFCDDRKNTYFLIKALNHEKWKRDRNGADAKKRKRSGDKPYIKLDCHLRSMTYLITSCPDLMHYIITEIIPTELKAVNNDNTPLFPQLRWIKNYIS